MRIFFILILLTGCDFFSKSTSKDVLKATFELVEEVPSLGICEGSRRIKYKVVKCYKNNEEVTANLCNHLSKEDLLVKSPAGTKTFAIEGDENNFVGDKTYNCGEGDAFSEERVSISCSDSRYIPYSLGTSTINNTCKPYPVDLHSGSYSNGDGYYEKFIVTDSIGDVFEVALKNNEIVKRKVNFPKVKVATAGYGGICGYQDKIVWCEQRGDFGFPVLSIDEMTDLSRDVSIKKLVHEGNLLCALYEDSEVACTSATRYRDVLQRNNRLQGATGRGLEYRGVSSGERTTFEKGPVIPEYSGAIDIVGTGLYHMSCALFEDNSVKCSGRIENLSVDENTEVTSPVIVDNTKRIGYEDSSYIIGLTFCPFPGVIQNNCLFEGVPLSGVSFFLVDNLVQKKIFLGYDNFLYVNDQDNFVLLNNLKVDKILYHGYFFISNKQLYLNQSTPRLIKVY